MGCYEIKREALTNQHIVHSLEDNDSEYNDKIICDVINHKNKLTSNNTFNSSTRDYQLGKSTFTITGKASDISGLSGNDTYHQKPSPLSNEKQNLTLKGISFDKYKHIFSGALPENSRFKGRKYKKEKTQV